jgi:octaprenyl-diphosphate synthase
MEAKQLRKLIKPIEPDLEVFDNRLAEGIKNDSPLISSIARHLMKSRGKRIRPAFMFLSSRAAEFFTENTIDASLAIELIHTATLLHDDVVDDAEVRRGQETVNFKWTNLISVLMGDYLFAKSFRLMIGIGSLALIDAVSYATERVSVGELRQIEETANYDLSETEYLRIIADKTASLFSVSCETGPILAGSSKKERKRFAEFGEKIGQAFQIADDLLDYVGDADITGKESGNDILSGKVTMPLIYALRHGERKKGREILKILDNGSNKRGFKKILKFVAESGGIDYTYRRASEIAHEGLGMVRGFKKSAYFDALLGMVDFSTTRVA